MIQKQLLSSFKINAVVNSVPFISCCFDDFRILLNNLSKSPDELDLAFHNDSSTKDSSCNGAGEYTCTCANGQATQTVTKNSMMSSF